MFIFKSISSKFKIISIFFLHIPGSILDQFHDVRDPEEVQNVKWIVQNVSPRQPETIEYVLRTGLSTTLTIGTVREQLPSCLKPQTPCVPRSESGENSLVLPAKLHIQSLARSPTSIPRMSWGAPVYHCLIENGANLRISQQTLPFQNLVTASPC